MIFCIAIIIVVVFILMYSARRKKEGLPAAVVKDIRPVPPPLDPIQTPMMNFDECNQWCTNPGYTECYRFTPYDQNECDLSARMDIDEKNSMYWRQANRDQKLLDGWASKNSDYYKKNFFNELDKSESKVWWGN